MSTPDCSQPNGKCQFSDGGQPGSIATQRWTCRHTTMPRTRSNGMSLAEAKWVSYDDAESWHDKKMRISENCLSGIMIWAIDQDTGNFDAMGQLFGDYTNLELDGLNNNSVEDLSDLFGQFIGQDYFVTECCTKDGDDKNGPDQVCPNSFRPVSTAHNAYQKLPRTLSATATRAGFAISAIPACPCP
ncbi:hypothetical protein S7711_06834 [Stachybotrys chartarum IBT 7711]|uniref:GH18 domain-containing protein n=1 Tax=Stachybotrys chartarum (strain CBS 109288 / IBT 7711) TaxID=1280523 RepID=A0A084B785_STACB|nr:hypothetical protein S7711_06834 [Stachybotrys chartarum IBT 7711]